MTAQWLENKNAIQVYYNDKGILTLISVALTNVLGLKTQGGRFHDLKLLQRMTFIPNVFQSAIKHYFDH